MQISPYSAIKLKTTFVVVAAIAICSCSSKPEQQAEQPPVVKVDQTLSAAGMIEMQLDGGDYNIRPVNDERIRVSFAGNIGNAAAEVTTSGPRANLVIKDTPRSNFRGTVEVPATANLTVHLTGGNLEIAGITGNKDINSKAGNVVISIPNANDYGTVDASVKVGDLKAGPFGDSDSGISPQIKWSGPGKYTLRVSLGVGNLELKD